MAANDQTLAQTPGATVDAADQGKPQEGSGSGPSANEFIGEIARRINDNGAVTVEEFLRRAQTYEEFQTFFSVHPEFVLRLVSEPQTEAVQEIRNLLTNPAAILSAGAPEGAQNLTQFKETENRLAQSVPTEVINANAREETWKQTISTVQTIRKRTNSKVDTFVKLLENKKLYDPHVPEAVKKELVEASYLPTFEQLRERWVKQIALSGKLNEKEARQVVDEYVAESHLDRDIETTARFVDTIANHKEITTPENIYESIERGERPDTTVYVGRMATVVRAPESFTRLPAEQVNKAFTAAAQTVFHGTSEVALRERFSEAWDAMVGDSSAMERVQKKLETTMGAAFSNDAFREYIRQNNQQIAQKRSGGGFGGFGSTARTPRPSEGEIESYVMLKFQYAPDAPLNPNEFFAAKAYAQYPEIFHLKESPLDWLVGLFTKKAAESGTATAAETAARGGVGTMTKDAAKAAAVKFLSTFLPAAVAEWLSGPLGWAVFFVTTFWGQIKGAFRAVGNWIATGANSGIRATSEGASELLRSWLNAPARKREWYDNWWILSIFFAGAAVLLLYSEAAAQNKAIQMNFIPADLGGVSGPFQPCDPLTDPTCVPLYCGVSPTPGTTPVSGGSTQACMWPTPCGCITQLPFNPGGSHHNLNAIDIGTNGSNCNDPHQPVFAMCAGVLHVGNMSLGDNEKCTDFQSAHCGYGYGNFVTLDCADGQTQFLYGHLVGLGPGISDGMTVQQSMVIAYTDNNGNSDGPHLHFEYRGQNGKSVQNIEKILPPNSGLGYCW